jgi:glycosyltransferase involved in cell wall biosynthesis
LSPPRHLLHVFPTFGFGGVPIRICNVINHFGRRYRHTIVALDNRFDSAARLDPDIEVRLGPVTASRYGLLRNLLRFRAMIRAARPDLLLTYNWGAIEWALANTLSPLCRHVHLESGFGPDEATRTIGRRALFRRIALARASRVIVPSQTLVDIATRVWRLDADKIVYIPNGVDCRRFAAPPVRGFPGGFTKAAEELVVGTVAPLRAEKNLGRLLRAFAVVAGRFEVRLLILGDGPERPKLTALATALGIDDRVVFAGHVDQVEKALGWFDLFALSSDTEQMPNSLLQAMAAGRPVVAVDVGDVRRVVANRAFVVAKDDEAGLCGAFERLLGDGATRARLGRLNQSRVRKHYTEARMFDAYETIFADRH